MPVQIAVRDMIRLNIESSSDLMFGIMDKNAPPTNITNSDFKIGRLEKNGFLIQLYMAIENVYIIGIQVKVEKKLCTSNSPYIYKNKGQESPVLQQNMEVV